MEMAKWHTFQMLTKRSDRMAEMLRGIHWVIVGGESGAGARPMQVDWVLRIQADCKRQRATFFFDRNHGGLPPPYTGKQLSGSNQRHHLVR